MPRTRFLSKAPIASACAGTAAALALFASAPVAADEQSESDIETEVETEELSKGEEKLAKLLEGRVAGEPVRCIRNRLNGQLRTIEDTAYVYGRGNTIYVQRTRDPGQIDRSNVLVSQQFNGTRLCKLDVVTAVDRLTGLFRGAVFFEDFVPYTRVEEDGEAS
ncbi:hypothetical protein [Erythrobacter rubeus]|uniref:Uncharacterized protein n=1 Tax=Erythrobacter rubeus TaxID=2760803 RepID=A0ABR8KTN2_9SPHN|nr:hypothetical protein [Erythrobacter rubeus]MBD2842955.1 hypothetical protein [Erythrobacter rubeus]